MNIHDYMKMRFYLNNRNYITLPPNQYMIDTTIIQKTFFAEDNETVKYSIKYYLRENSGEHIHADDSKYRFGVSVNALFCFKNTNENDTGKYVDRDTLNINYYLHDFKEPEIIEQHFEKMWYSLNEELDHYPHKGFF